MRVVLQVVLGSETWAVDGWSAILRSTPPLSAMLLKQRIFLGLAPILILSVGFGLYALWLFTRLGGAVDVILRENYQRVLAGQNGVKA